MTNYDFLKDKNFLTQFDELQIKSQFIKLTILDWQENPLNEIQGKVINGSININGSSSLRRTASLTIIADPVKNDLSQIDTDLSINRKIKMEIGFKNTVPFASFSYFDTKQQQITQTINYQKKYGDIIWFPLGIYVIFDPNISRSTSGITISVSLKDKMCLLNGDAGGIIPATTEFHKREKIDENGVKIIQYPLIHEIIQECVHHFGKEDPAKIIIEDIDNRIKQVMRWMNHSTLYYYSNINVYTVKRKPNRESDEKQFQYGDEIGFILTDFTYPGELIGDIGSTVTSILDKIISVLGNFEYFYDVFGNFHFQEIKNYLNITYTTQAFKSNTIDEIDYNVSQVSNQAVYKFNGTKLISSISNSPKYSNIKNDFLVWGIRKSATGAETPIRYHLAIDNIPSGQAHTHITKYIDEEDKLQKLKYTTSGGNFTTKDFREELYVQGLEAQNTGSDYPYYFTELVSELPKVWDFDNQNFKTEYINNPFKFDFFLDIISPNSIIGKYSVENIGRRSVVVSDDKINCMFEQDIPDLVIININEDNAINDTIKDECNTTGQKYTQVSNAVYNNLAIGGIQNSCYQRICEMLYQYTVMNNTITLQTVPIYYLEPNTRIYVEDIKSGIVGDFIIQTISLPLGTDGTMSITANAVLQKM